MCEANGGLYVKLGQAIGVQAAVLPKPYHALAKMFDDAEHLDYPTVRKVVESELGKSVDEVSVSVRCAVTGFQADSRTRFFAGFRKLR